MISRPPGSTACQQLRRDPATACYSCETRTRLQTGILNSWKYCKFGDVCCCFAAFKQGQTRNRKQSGAESRPNDLQPERPQPAHLVPTAIHPECSRALLLTLTALTCVPPPGSSIAQSSHSRLALLREERFSAKMAQAILAQAILAQATFWVLQQCDIDDTGR